MGNWLERWFPPEPAPAPEAPPPAPGPDPKQLLQANLEAARTLLQGALSGSPDATFRSFATAGGVQGCLLFIPDLVDDERLEKEVLEILQKAQLAPADLPADVAGLHQRLASAVLPSAQMKEGRTLGDLLTGVLDGLAALLVDGVPGAVLLSYRKWAAREPGEPSAEPVIRGPKEGFTEDIRVNRALLRRRLRSADLQFENLTIGRYTHTRVMLVYLGTTVMPGLVDEVRSRLAGIQIDELQSAAYIEEFIEDHPYSPFSQVQNTERPDVVATSLVSGRVAILMDGSPSALLVPTTFFHLMQASEDYYERWIITSMIRLLRYVLLVMALILPSLYIATTTFHPEMVPTNLLITITAVREGVPFPAVIEATLMEVAFEALREAGIRLPRQVGQAVSIVGALVIGQAAVQAGIVSAPMVIIVSITGIASFTAPRYNAAIAVRLLRFPLMILGATLGLFGVMSGLLAIWIHLASLRSFGIPYFSPIMPLTIADLKDVLFRAPHWAMRLRPQGIGRANLVRVPSGQRPGPPTGSK